MLRSVLVGLLSLAVLPACGKTAAPTVQPGAIAGNVVEVTGEVSVVHAGETRPLAKGATVTADDEIVTGADGRVAIVLAHNHARWDVKPGTRKKVSDSAAWGLAMVDHPADVVEHDTSAAGRDQEKAGADTSVTAATTGAPSAVPAAPPVEGGAKGDLAPQAPPPPPKSAGPRTEPLLEPAKPAETERKEEAMRADDQAPGGVDKDEAKQKEATVITGGKLGASLSADASATSDAHRASNHPVGAGAPPPPADPERATFAPQRAALTACLDPGTTRKLTIKVAHGARTFTLTGGTVTPATKQCVAKIVKTLDLAADTTTVVKLTRE